jgi:DNA polymerase epsilon subunit 1
VKREEERETTVCMRENSFYVDTVRAFRDRRYEYKGLLKQWKKNLSTAVDSKDPLEVKRCNSMVVLYDSLQLAHKCILNSFYGYVMRRGARWYSMEMAGIVCHTGSDIILRSKELIEKIGRPLELDTDGIWCILPATFPENFVFKTNDAKKKLTISYPCSMLNLLVRDHYTNDQYHELVDKNLLKYEIKSENSVFFEVDGPYYAMVLPASKEEGKRLKKRYAVFNFDGSLAELKGFEVKRNGELQLIKIFQSSIFEAFLKGTTLDECYESVAKIANYWLDVLYSKAEHMPDYELFDLISEKRTMSKALEDYGAQKSTSISTAKRLAEFLGDEMVKDKGLNCKYIISKKPEGSPVAERAIPIAIFQAEPAVCKHYLRKWLRAQSVEDIEVRNFLDWNYYIERLSSCIQKIITIPAALQGVTNPVLRVPHPDWLYKILNERNSTLKQRKIDDIFSLAPRQPLSAELNNIIDIEDMASTNKQQTKQQTSIITQKTSKPSNENINPNGGGGLKRKIGLCDKETDAGDWKSILGDPPKLDLSTKATFQQWHSYQKKKWIIQLQHRRQYQKYQQKNNDKTPSNNFTFSTNSLTDFVHRSATTKLKNAWQILRITPTQQCGVYRMWILVDADIYSINLKMTRNFYVNQIKAPEKESTLCRRANKHLPRSQMSFNLYEYSIPEDIFQAHYNEIMNEFSTPNVEGVYELNVPLLFGLQVRLGCVCGLKKTAANRGFKNFDTFDINDMETQSEVNYLEVIPNLKNIYLFIHSNANKMIMGLFIPQTNTGQVFVLDSVRTNNMPNLNNLFNNERDRRLNCGIDEDLLPNANYKFEIKIETNEGKLFKALDRSLSLYKDEKRGSTLLLLQSNIDESTLKANIPLIDDFPIVKINVQERHGLFNVLDWQKVAVKHLIPHYMNVNTILANMIEQARYYQIPVGNLPFDAALYACDLFYARHLYKNNYILWSSPTSFPDLGGKQYDDYRLIQNNIDTSTTSNSNICAQVNNPGFYHNMCLDMDINSLAISALLQLTKINEFDGASSVNFSVAPQTSVEQMIAGDLGTAIFSSYYDEAALSVSALRIMRTMVQYWLRDVASFGNVFADMQIMHFYRWLQSPSSLLYDPAVRRTLQSYMKKLCILLINELKRLGANIVYADLSRIIVCTNKFTVDDALAYMKYLLNNLQSKDLFSTIHIDTSKIWTILLWQDSANYGGIKINFDNESGENGKEEVEMNLKMSTFLPEIVEENLIALIAGYVGSVNEQLKQSHSSTSSSLVKKNNETVEGAKKESENLVKFCQDLVSGEITEQLMRLTQKIYKKLTDEDFPEQFGCRYKLRCPALEFVKYTCKILSLDKNLVNQVSKLKKDLLKIINVREFSDEAQYVDPSLSFVIPQIICLKCNHCRDIDLCRDPYSNLNENDTTKPIGWYCMNCEEYYDLDQIESYLIEALHAKVMCHVTQDIKCVKCQEVIIFFISIFNFNSFFKL